MQTSTSGPATARIEFPPVADQLDLLEKGTAEILPHGALRERLELSARTGRPLRVKAGFDPTAPDLHLGHTVLMRKLRHFQQLGHTVIFLIGDATALIGDPTGRNVTRKPLTREADRRERRDLQAAGLQNPRRRKDRGPLQLRVARQAQLLRGIVRLLAAKFTISQMLEREDFHKRFEDEQPIALHEMVYPMAQGYDSVML